MIPLFQLYMCVLMHGYEYRIEEVKPEVYLLSQTVTVFEELNTYKQYWKYDYVDKVARRTKCSNKYKDIK